MFFNHVDYFYRWSTLKKTFFKALSLYYDHAEFEYTDLHFKKIVGGLLSDTPTEYKVPQSQHVTVA